MSATLRRRLAALEAALPPPPAELPDDRWWWEALPPAVKAYVLALPAEVHDDPRLQPQPIPGDEGVLYYRRIFGADSAGLAVLDLLIVRRWDGEPVALAEAQDSSSCTPGWRCPATCTPTATTGPRSARRNGG